jgi:zinc protease
MRIRLAVAGAALVAFGPMAGRAQYPTTPPAAAPIRPAAFPPYQQATLPNGLRMIVVQSKKQPVVSVSLSFNAGSAHDPAGKSGLAEMAAGLLTKGAGKRSADEIAAAIEGVGGSIGAGTDEDFLTLRADALANDARLAFELVADAAIRPAFPDKELELLRSQSLSGLQLELSQPASLATRALLKGLYGAHPYSRRPDAASVKAITRDDLVQFQKTRLRPSGALLVVAGSLSLAEAQKLASTAFAGWAGAPATTAAGATPPARSTAEIVLVHKPGAVQSNIVAGNLTWMPTDPRRYAAAVGTRLLGGGADSRLFLILREQKSWTYGAAARLVRQRGVGHFEATTEVRTDVTDSALVELLAQLKRMSAEAIAADELERVKNAMTGAFPTTIETASQVAGQVASATLYGLPSDFVATYRQKLAAVTAKDVQAAAKVAIRPDAALIVVVGDGAKLYAKLKAIAPVSIVSAEGTSLTPDDLVVKAAALDLALDRLVARTDSFAIFVQGNPFGYQTSKLERVDGGWKYSEATRLSTFIQQNTEVRFTDKMVMQSVSQTGKVQGQDTKIDVTYALGRAKGSAAIPGQAGVKTIAVDADVPVGAIDDNLVTVILPALKWAAGAKFTIPIFQPGKGSVNAIVLTVAGEESVDVPAGKFDAYKVGATGGDSPLTIWVEKAAPNRLLKLAIAGQPVEFRLVK